MKKLLYLTVVLFLFCGCKKTSNDSPKIELLFQTNNKNVYRFSDNGKTLILEIWSDSIKVIYTLPEPKKEPFKEKPLNPAKHYPLIF